MFCALELVFDGTDGVESRFHVLRSQTRFRRCGGCRVPLSCYALQDSFSVDPRASGPLFIFYAPRLVFGGTEGVGYHFLILHSQTHFRRYRRRPILFSCFVLRTTFSAVRRALGPVFKFCAPGLIFNDTEGVGSGFHVLRSRTHFRRYRGRWLRFSCCERPDSFSAVPRASGPVFMSCTPGLIFIGTEGVGSHFHVLRSWTRFRRYRGSLVTFSSFCVRTHFRRYRERPVQFSCFALPVMFLEVRRAYAPIFMFCAPGLVFGGTVGVDTGFHVLGARTHFRRN
jgi:hypothetical protein